MNKVSKILLAALLFSAVVFNKKICAHLGFGQAKMHQSNEEFIDNLESKKDEAEENGNYFVNDSIYRWDGYYVDWVGVKEENEFKAEFVSYTPDITDPENTVVTWETLNNVRYRLRYFKEIKMEMYAPIFSKALKQLDGKEVTVEGFVIPFEVDTESIALSENPFASCFFCGKASPASVISMYLEEGEGPYKMDDFKKFKGILKLNQDDPNEFYYILNGAKAVK